MLNKRDYIVDCPEMERNIRQRNQARKRWLKSAAERKLDAYEAVAAVFKDRNDTHFDQARGDVKKVVLRNARCLSLLEDWSLRLAGFFSGGLAGHPWAGAQLSGTAIFDEQGGLVSLEAEQVKDRGGPGQSIENIQLTREPSGIQAWSSRVRLSLDDTGGLAGDANQAWKISVLPDQSLEAELEEEVVPSTGGRPERLQMSGEFARPSPI